MSEVVRVIKNISLIVSLILCACGARAEGLALVGATVYQTPASQPRSDTVVVMRDGVITQVGWRARTRIPPDVRVVDVTGLFVTAGFWNSHVHLLTPGLLQAAKRDAAGLQRELDSMLNRWGFTTVFDTGSVLNNTQALRRRIEKGELRGPRIFTVGEPIWTAVPVYVADYLAENHIDMPVVKTRKQALRRVRALAARGVDGIKLFTGSLQEDHVTHMPAGIAQAVVAEAHRLRLPVFAHAQDYDGLDTALKSGVDILAHTAPAISDWTPKFVPEMVKAGMALIPTLTLFDVEARRSGNSEEVLKFLPGRAVEELRAFAGGNGRVLFGTDAGYLPQFDNGAELQMMSEAGLDFRQILAALTTHPARQFGMRDDSACVHRGFAADLVVLDADPAEDVENFARVRYTIRAGKVIYSAP